MELDIQIFIDLKKNDFFSLEELLSDKYHMQYENSDDDLFNVKISYYYDGDEEMENLIISVLDDFYFINRLRPINSIFDLGFYIDVNINSFFSTIIPNSVIRKICNLGFDLSINAYPCDG